MFHVKHVQVSCLVAELIQGLLLCSSVDYCTKLAAVSTPSFGPFEDITHRLADRVIEQTAYQILDHVSCS
jgi:hypothetical protein